MVEKIQGNAEILLTQEEAELYAAQQEAAASADTWKQDANYQNEPNGAEQCSGCGHFVPGFPDDPGGYCDKVRSVRGPAGMIFPDGWCEFFIPDDEELVEQYAERLNKPDKEKPTGTNIFIHRKR